MQLLVQATVVDSDRVPIEWDSLRPEREHEPSYAISSPASVWTICQRDQPMPTYRSELGARVVNDRRERITLRRTVSKRLTDSHRAIDKSSSGAMTVTSVQSEASSRRASAASKAATPPPTMITRSFSVGLTCVPPCQASRDVEARDHAEGLSRVGRDDDQCEQLCSPMICAACWMLSRG